MELAWMLFCSSNTWSDNSEDLGLIASLLTICSCNYREKELFSASGNDLDYYSVKGATAIDFRADNDTNLESLEKNSLDFYSSLKSIYLQDRENKIKNSSDDMEDWDNLDN